MPARFSLLALTLLLPLAAQAADCPALLKTQGELPKLRSRTYSTFASSTPASRWWW